MEHTASRSAVAAGDAGHRRYRQALSCFATGVTVLTTRWDTQDWGMTCNSFASVSLAPPLVSWNIRRQSGSLHAFLGADRFAVSVLSSEQGPLAQQFAQGEMANRFKGVDLRRGHGDLPLLVGALAHFECRRVQHIDIGDHCLMIGEVVDFSFQTDRAALGFWRSGFVAVGEPVSQSG